MTTPEWWAVIVAGYAAIVGTGALALEIRRWVEAGARLVLNVMPQAETFGLPSTEGNTYIVATITNRGDAPTTITHFALFEFESAWSRFFRKASWSAIVPHPQPRGFDPIIPKVVGPGETWTGMALYNDELVSRVERGKVCIGIYASHSDRSVIQRVTPPPNPDQLDNGARS